VWDLKPPQDATHRSLPSWKYSFSDDDTKFCQTKTEGIDVQKFALAIQLQKTSHKHKALIKKKPK